MRNTNMIFIYDVFTDILEDRFKLNPYELYLYCYLYRNRSHDYTVSLSVDTIHMCMPVKFHKSVESKNRKMIKEYLVSLKDKGIIEYKCDQEILNSRTGNSFGLNIGFLTFTDKKGYLQLPYEQFDAADDIYEFYIRVAVGRFNNVTTASKYGGRWISEKEFADLLGVSKRTFFNYVEKMRKEKKLYRKSGSRQEEGKIQDKNIYKTVPFGVVEYDEYIENDIDYDPEDELDTVDGQHTVSDIREFAGNTAWDNPDESGILPRIEYEDYKWYRIVKDYRIDKKFVLKCVKTIRKIGNEKFGEYEERYRSEKESLRN